MASCKLNPNLQGAGAGFVQGIWVEQEVGYRDELLQYTTHSFRFSCDSFYVTLNTYARANYNPDSCFNNGRWIEYAKGNYAVKGDSVFLSGTFTKSNFKQKISGCYRNGQYLETFVVKEKADSYLQLESLKSHFPIKLILKELLVCNPQPLN